MRSMPIAVTVTTALLLLTACGGEGGGDGAEDKNDAKQESGACSSATVSLEAGPASEAPAAGDTGEVPVNLVDQGGACVLDGFPEVSLVVGGEPVALPPAEGATARELTLAEGEAASFTITYVRGPKGADGSLDATSLRIGLPGDSATRDFPWMYGPVAVKEPAETAADASVSTFQRTGD
ncbi:DUF4232 domain-containing protein [Streptomyces sp. KMM 9044]|uniref:DUF4232 domain-containing protein n=1 Tax=Streptomyces sp. KMM 9044 TaxID=2744474 RepID=UPI00215096F8|nr:DUF4232 domain-containing protein [Streptomyces sp. KMM 9044]WAX78754.1 DUF4232 domain-containing protein [Streptomyces sp. KMM 9044]